MKTKLSSLIVVSLLLLGSSVRAERMGFSPQDCQLPTNDYAVAPPLQYNSIGGQTAMAMPLSPNNGLVGPISCPIIGHTNAITKVEIAMWDRHFSLDINCTLLLFDDLGTIVYSNTRNTVSQNFNSPMYFTWTQITGGGKYGTITCQLPGKIFDSDIIYYTAEEP